MRMRILGLILIATLAVAAAQTKDKKSAKPAGNPPMPMMKQSAEMAKLQKLFAGTWTLEATMEPMPEMGMTQPAKSHGTQTSKMGPGGNSMIDDMKSTGPSGTIVGHGVMWWDPQAGAYQAVWCDNQTPGGCMMNGNGKWDGDNLVTEFDSPMPPEMGGGKMHMKESWTDIKPGSFTFSMDGGPDADHMKHMMTIKYTRAKAAAAAKK